MLKENKDYVDEITSEIFNIRKKRLELLAGGSATAEALKALDELEGKLHEFVHGKRGKT